MAKTEAVRQVNIQQILDVFMHQGVCTKNMLHEATGLSLGTCTNLIQKLLKAGQIIRLEDGPSTGGRKAKRYALAEDFTQMGLIILHHHESSDEIRGRVINLRQNEVYASSKTDEKMKKEALFEIIKEMKENCPRMSCVAISVPGVVDQGYIRFCDMEAFKENNLQKELSDRFNLTFILENDVNLAALGYEHALPEKVQSLALVYQPSDQYSGCGMIINNQMIKGATHFAGELGYLPIETRENQLKSLKTKKGATALLAKQVASVIAVINPAVVVIYSKKLSSVEKLKAKVSKWIDEVHLPKIIQIYELDNYIFSGLGQLCLESIRIKTNLE